MLPWKNLDFKTLRNALLGAVEKLRTIIDAGIPLQHLMVTFWSDPLTDHILGRLLFKANFLACSL